MNENDHRQLHSMFARGIEKRGDEATGQAILEDAKAYAAKNPDLTCEWEPSGLFRFLEASAREEERTRPKGRLRKESDSNAQWKETPVKTKEEVFTMANEATALTYGNSDMRPIGQQSQVQRPPAQDSKPNPMAGTEIIELPRENAYGNQVTHVDSVQIQHVPNHLQKRWQGSIDQSGTALVKSMKWDLQAVEGANIFDSHTLRNLKSLAKEVEAAPTYDARKQIFDSKISPYLRALSMATRQQ